ncbi:hypothetical protein [Branchiibius sp. NY16-3462-2]|uniref:hypothetical protein n=1 Tax=Branchiibius sp. NY16-3462-2 TaxID=1807500 RepID=UPI0007999C35|nr:hypothetical protein [Branchiibius sp. NY16-3462-2]KYH44653.1 hypothetical protein AZH51_00330 [Branchiibius sp. NY16-3462-2]
MSVELEELFHDLDAPTMSVSADSVVASGQRKVRRRRALWGAGTGALAAAAAVAIAVGTALPNSSSPSPMPAHSSKSSTFGSFFQRTGDEAAMPLDEMTSTAMSKADDPPTPSTTYQVYREDGILRIRRIDKGGSVNLPEVAQFKDGGSATNDRNQTVVVRPVPADTRSADLELAPTNQAGGMISDGVVLPDGTTAAVFVTERRINPAKDVEYVTWWTTGGQLKASTGEVAQVVDLPGTFNDRTLRGWSFPTLGTCGVITSGGGGGSSSTTTSGDDGFCTLDVAFGDPAKSMTAVWLTVRPGPVSNIEVVPAKNAPTFHVQATPTGGTDVMLYAIASVNEKQYTDGLVSTVTWTGPDGKTMTFRHDK